MSSYVSACFSAMVGSAKSAARVGISTCTTYGFEVSKEAMTSRTSSHCVQTAITRHISTAPRTHCFVSDLDRNCLFARKKDGFVELTIVIEKQIHTRVASDTYDRMPFNN